MSETLLWHPIYNIGVHEIDVQHKTLFAMCKQMCTFAQTGAYENELNDLIHDFLGYLSYHNCFEETLMRILDYPNREAHIKEHHLLTQKLRGLLRPHDETYNLISESKYLFMETLAEHVSGDDLELGRFLKDTIPAEVNPRDYMFSAVS